MIFRKNDWVVVYNSAINPDGSLYFPERLDESELLKKRKELGSYEYTNQYLNQVIPPEDQLFKEAWLKKYNQIPENVNWFAAIDPAISMSDNSDFTALVVVAVDESANWYLHTARRFRVTPTEIIDLIFKIHEHFKPKAVAVEAVAFQKMIIHVAIEEMKKRNVWVNLAEVKHGAERSKEQRISGLVPRFEFGNILINVGLDDFEEEYLTFPSGLHDDLLDALEMIQEIAYKPQSRRKIDDRPRSPTDHEHRAIRERAFGKKRSSYQR